MMKQRMLGAAVVTLMAMSAGSVVNAADTAPTVKRTEVKKERVVTASAIVQAIDLDKRIVTLKGADGKIQDLKVGPEARNLPQVKVGDEVTVKYYESIAYRLLKPGEATAPTQGAAVVEWAKPGEKPGGMVAGEVTVTATIEAIDKKAQKVTLKGPNGRSITVKAQDPKNLERVKVGDEVVITYTEAIAISVTAAKK